MKIEELKDAPKWLLDAKTKNADVQIIDGVVHWYGGVWLDGYWEGGVWNGGTWHGGTWCGGVWKRGYRFTDAAPTNRFYEDMKLILKAKRAWEAKSLSKQNGNA